MGRQRMVAIQRTDQVRPPRGDGGYVGDNPRWPASFDREVLALAVRTGLEVSGSVAQVSSFDGERYGVSAGH
jgi:hypothetical protein